MHAVCIFGYHSFLTSHLHGFSTMVRVLINILPLLRWLSMVYCVFVRFIIHLSWASQCAEYSKKKEFWLTWCKSFIIVGTSDHNNKNPHTCYGNRVNILWWGISQQKLDITEEFINLDKFNSSSISYDFIIIIVYTMTKHTIHTQYIGPNWLQSYFL